ncbi:MAG: HAMP domain-containing sensor histidine kinase [Clostridiaceae bacterium]|nr:HAMP domain-containing sensor histidine kinase [Clostridiaceae bacterium]
MKKISVRLWIQMLMLIGITLGLLWVFQIVMLEQYYLYSQTRNIKQEGIALAKAYEEGMNEELLAEKAEELSLKYNAGVEIYSIKGERIYGYSLMPMMMGRALYKQEVFSEAAKGEAIVRQVKHNRLNSNVTLVGIPIREGPKVRGVMIVSAPLAAIKETKEILKEQLIIITVILVLISLLLTYYSSKAFTKPILKINEAAAKMAAGNLTVRVDVDSSDELGMLSDTINNLSVQLQKIEQLRKDLIANVSHEFRTPLSLIKGYAETIRDITGDMKDKRNSQLNIILEETDRLKNLVDDTLNLSQMQSGNFHTDIKPFDISEAVSNIAGRFSYVSEEKGISLDLQGNKDSNIVLGDEPRIEQVIYNFVNNAFNHTNSGGRVSVEILRNEDNVRIEVSDNGRGVPAEELPYIWDRFYKASKDDKGKGLGLSIAKGILEAHGSKYGVMSKPGEGATFWFTLMRA